MTIHVDHLFGTRIEMSHTLIQLYKNLLTYDGHDVYVVFDDTEPYFHAKQLCQLLGYVDFRDAIRTHIEKKDIYYLEDIVDDYGALYKNAQGHTKFLSEAGMMLLIMSSKHKKAKEIKDWIARDVVPAIRKYGEYIATHEYKQQIDELKIIIDAKSKEIEIQKHNLKKQKFKKESIVYILRNVDDTTNLELDAEEILTLRFGKTKDVNFRKPPHDSATKDRSQIIKQIAVKDIGMIEKCVFSKLDNFRVRDNSSFLECTYNQLINTIADCVKFFENIDIDKIPDVHKKMVRENNNEKFNTEEKYLVKIEFESDDGDDDENNDYYDDDDNVQIGGAQSQHNIEINYLSYKLKYLELKRATSYFL